MATWNPNPTIGGASWQGNAPLVTKNQLLSTSYGFYEDLKDFNFSTISVSTLTVPIWVSTPLLYVSDIQGYNVAITQDVSANTGIFNITNVSVMQLTFKPTFTGNIQVTFDLGLGQAIGGLLAGLGAAVGGAFIGLGTGVGLAIQGAEQGIATMIAGRPQNFITQNTYETINFTSQLQVSTLGNANPVYSTIFRTVSSVSANSVPGREIFTSSFFYPGQICVRTVSDPINLITGDSNLNTSTIQSFGQWTPLIGLEPENVIADSISANKISTGLLYAELAQFGDINSYSGLFSTVGVANNLSMNYQAPITFQTGATNYGAIGGNLNRLYMQTTNGIIFSQYGSYTENASLYVGCNANESLLNVSSIFSRGNIQANSGFFSSLTAETLTVVSTINLTSTNVENITSTATIYANQAYITDLYISTIAPFQISSVLGNSNGPFDIKIYDSLLSTSYDQISSIQQNILNASLNIQLQEEALFDIGDTSPGTLYSVTPCNVGQWASTILQWSGWRAGAGQIDLGFRGQWAVSPGVPDTTGGIAITGATFDVRINPINNGSGGNVTSPFYLTEQSNNAYPFGVSTMIQIPDLNPNVYNFRVTLPPAVGGTNPGWWRVDPWPGPYESENNNTFQIYQDINDTYITASDRLHIQAGDIFLDGSLNLSNFTTNNFVAQNATFSQGFISSLSSVIINASNIIANPLTGGLNTYYYKSTISWNNPPQSMIPLEMTFSNDSPDFIPIYGLVPPFIGTNYFTSYNVGSWCNSQWNNSVTYSLGVPKVFVGDLQAGSAYSGFFYINNDIVSPSYVLPVYQLTSAGPTLLGNINGGTYAKISTSNGTNWVLTSNVANPQGSGGSFINKMSVTQGYTQTDLTNTQNLAINAPNTYFNTGTMYCYADQIRVNSHTYGPYATTGLGSYPIGIENTVYIDGNMSFSNSPGLDATYWQSDAANVLYNITNTIYYDANSWIVQVIPSRFRTNNSLVVSWDVQPAIFPVGGGGYCWGYNRYIQVNTTITGPGSNANNWNWVIAIPRNYCTY